MTVKGYLVFCGVLLLGGIVLTWWFLAQPGSQPAWQGLLSGLVVVLIASGVRYWYEASR